MKLAALVIDAFREATAGWILPVTVILALLPGGFFAGIGYGPAAADPRLIATTLSFAGPTAEIAERGGRVRETAIRWSVTPVTGTPSGNRPFVVDLLPQVPSAEIGDWMPIPAGTPFRFWCVRTALI